MLTLEKIVKQKMNRIEELLKPSHRVQISGEIRDELELHLSVLRYIIEREFEE